MAPKIKKNKVIHLKNGLSKVIIKSPKFGIKECIIDTEDYIKIEKYNWHVTYKKNTSNFYATTNLYIPETKKMTTIKMHSIILNCKKREIVDHKDFNGLNNCKKNIRKSNFNQNVWNVRKYTGKSKFKGVHFRKDRGKWIARIGFNGKRLTLGSFNNEIDAAKCFNEAAKKYQGEFAYLNEV